MLEVYKGKERAHVRALWAIDSNIIHASERSDTYIYTPVIIRKIDVRSHAWCARAHINYHWPNNKPPRVQARANL